MRYTSCSLTTGKFVILWNIAVLISALLLLLLISLTSAILATQNATGISSKANVIQKTQKLQMPFIANNGQTDKRVKFYTKTFGGTVFVTKNGEIVYSLPAKSSGPKDGNQRSGVGDRECMRHESRGVGAKEQVGTNRRQKAGFSLVIVDINQFCY